MAKRMSKRDRATQLAYIKEMLVETKRMRAEAMASDPFWYYEPSTGDISEKGRQILETYLQPNDIPQSGGVQGQLDIHLSNADKIADFGGNQGGKTTCGAIEGYIWATGELPIALEGIYPKEKIPTKFPQHIRVTGVDWKTVKANVIPAYQYWCPKEYLIDGSFTKSYSAEDRILKLGKNGELKGSIEFMTNKMDVESFQGPPRHGMIYDEEPRYEIYKENLMRFTTADRLKILFAMTPTKGLTWMHEEIVLKAPHSNGKIECFQIPSITNKMANLDILTEILDGIADYEERKMRLLGEMVSLSGLVYGKLYSDKIHLIEPFKIRWHEHVVYRGLDPHLTTPTWCVELAVDREGNEYVIGSYHNDADTEVIKKDLADRVRENKWRLGWSICDKSADSTIKVLNDRNVYRELARGANAIPALFTSEKFTGSIHAGVNEIKKLLRVDEDTKIPKLFIFKTPENKDLITAFKTLERDRGLNEEKTGKVDKINEGKYHAHACLRYMHQKKLRWMAPVQSVPEAEIINKAVNY